MLDYNNNSNDFINTIAKDCLLSIVIFISCELIFYLKTKSIEIYLYDNEKFVLVEYSVIK